MAKIPFIDKSIPEITPGRRRLLAAHTVMTGTFPLFWSTALFAATLHPGQPRSFLAQQMAFPDINIAASKRDILGYGLRGMGLIDNRRGPGGGMKLTRCASTINLGEILEASVVALSCPYRVSKKPQGTETGLIDFLAGEVDLGEMVYNALHSIMKEIPLDAAFPEIVARSNQFADESFDSEATRESKRRQAAAQTRRVNSARGQIDRRSISVVMARSSIFLPEVMLELNVPYIDPFSPLHKLNQTPGPWATVDENPAERRA